MSVSSNDILLKIKQSIFNLAEQYEIFSKDSTKSHEEIKDFDKELGDLIERLKQLEAVDFTITDIELTDTVNESSQKIEEINNLILSITNKLDSGFFKGDKGDKGDQGIQGIQGLKGDKGDQGIQGIQGVKGDNGDFLAQDYNNLTNKPIDKTRTNLNFFEFSFNGNVIGSEYLHLKTNISKFNKLLRFKFSGYAYGAARNIDSYLVGYTATQYEYLYNSKIINNDYGLVLDTYYSDDGYLVIVCFNMAETCSYNCSLSVPHPNYSFDVSTARVTDYQFTSDSQAQLFKGL